MKIKNILHYLPSSKSEMTSKEAYESRICAIAPIKKQPTGNDSQTIYYGLSTDFTQQTDAKFILSDKPVSLQYGKECNFILTNKKDLYKAVNTIEDLLAQDRLLTEYKNDMFEALIEKKSLSSILSKTFEYLENPIIVTDSRYRLIELYPDKKLNEPVWDSIREKGHAPQELMDQIESDQTKEKTLGSTYPFILNWGFAENFRRIAGKIHDDKRFFGVIGVLESYRSFKRIDLEIVHELSKIIRNQIVATNPPNEEEISYQQTLLTNLIDGDIEDERQLSNSLNMSGVRWNKPYQFVVIPFNINNFNLSVLRSLQKELLTKLQDAQATVHLSNIVVLLHGPHRNISLKTIRSILLRYAFDCGISLEFSDLTKSPVYYQQAKTAYRYGVKEETDRKQHFFRDYYRHSLVDALSKRYAPDFFIHPKLYELIHHDAIHRSQLSETLYQYLDAYKNINTTAKILHIHRNTLQYRLKKIEEILSISFNDPPSCHQLHIGLMLLKKTRAF